MAQTENRIISLEDDSIEIVFSYNEEDKVWNGDYPDFEEEPRFTPSGKPWVNVISDSCPLATEKYGDCGSCKFLKKESATDLIGICDNPEKKKR